MTQVFNRDCMEAMREFPDKFFELAIVDPPYGIGADEKNNGKNSDRHAQTSLAKINTFKKSNWDNSVPNHSYFDELYRISKRQIIWGANYFGLSGGFLYWHKNVTMPTYSSGELAWLSWLNKVEFIDITWHGMLQDDMKNKETRIHPTQKPIALYKWLLKNYAKSGDKILDTHLGSGSSRIAADQMGFDFWGYELDKDYFDASVKRFNQYKAQTVLF